jgi:hypothetical protein
MNAFVKALIVIAVIGVIAQLIAVAIPTGITTSINGAIIYFLETLGQLQGLFNVSTLFTCIQILGNFFIGIAGFVIIFWIGHMFIA